MSLNRIYTGKGLIIALVVGFLAVEAIVAALGGGDLGAYERVKLVEQRHGQRAPLESRCKTSAVYGEAGRGYRGRGNFRPLVRRVRPPADDGDADR